jgi:hypothetical protein
MNNKEHIEYNQEELLLAKYNVLRQLWEISNCHGIRLSQNYDINSNYEEMYKELKMHKFILARTKEEEYRKQQEEKEQKLMKTLLLGSLMILEKIHEKYFAPGDGSLTKAAIK